ncbi:hypothetical protein ACFSCX_09120 [Bacillus salitolerans]|uniref:Uncharacterized protein n=1 Tax=Bacillus salitolerans TaxID=1437434 RepID=A0ABW4LNQ1_9BACI
MVIQPNMKVRDVVDIWGLETTKIFQNYGIDINDKQICDSISIEILDDLIKDLNHAIGSSSSTCIEGG